MNVVVYTAAIGDTDPVRAPLRVDPDARYLCFSDKPCPAPYEWMLTPTGESPRLTARRIKILADHPLLLSAHVTLWHDASYRLRGDVRWLRRAVGKADILAMHHPRRSSIEAEAPIVARYGYVSLDEAMAHVARYRADGFAADVLTCSGLLARRRSPRMQLFNRRWWDEAQRWNGRDQTSLDYAAWMEGLRVRHISGAIRNNRYAEWRELSQVPA